MERINKQSNLYEQFLIYSYKSIYYQMNKTENRINTDEMMARIGSWD